MRACAESMERINRKREGNTLMITASFRLVAVVIVGIFLLPGFALGSVAPEGSHRVIVKPRDTVLGSIRREASTGMREDAFLKEMRKFNPGTNLHLILPGQALFIPNGTREENARLLTELAKVTTEKGHMETRFQEPTTTAIAVQEALEEAGRVNENLRAELAKVLGEKAEVEARLQKSIAATTGEVSSTHPITKAAVWIVSLLTIGIGGFICFSRGRLCKVRDIESLQREKLHLMRDLDAVKEKASRMEKYFPGKPWECRISNPLDRLDCELNGKETKIQCTIMRTTFNPAHPDEPILEVKSDHAKEWIFTRNIKNSYMMAMRRRLLAEKNSSSDATI